MRRSLDLSVRLNKMNANLVSISSNCREGQEGGREKVLWFQAPFDHCGGLSLCSETDLSDAPASPLCTAAVHVTRAATVPDGAAPAWPLLC